MASDEKMGVWHTHDSGSAYGDGGGGEGGRKIRVLVVDDHPQYRRGLISVLELEPDMEPVGETSSGARPWSRWPASSPTSSSWT